jgi:DNA replication initiation complex subunit (GINS family)
MDLQKDYDALYAHWHKEFLQVEITPLSQSQYNRYQNFLQEIKGHTLETSVPALKKKIFQKYKDNISFLYNDLLKIREIKIINTALALQEINLSHLIEPEQLLYKNLIRSIKGFNKLKAMKDTGLETDLELEGFPVKEATPLESRESKAPSEKVVQEVEREEKHSQEEEIRPSTSETERDISLGEISSQLNKSEIEYILVRFLRDCPALIGADLINYAPFQKEDIASLPAPNAKILIMEKFAEKINVTK